MKLNIEELAREAGFRSKNGLTRVQHSNGSFVVINEKLEAFARLIVERCAAEAELIQLPDGINLTGQMPSSAWEIGTMDAAAAIRNLLGDE